MSRISMIKADDATGVTADVFGQIKKAVGKVPNAYATIGSHNIAALQALLQADAALAKSSLSKQDQETIKLAVSEAAACDYCVAAHTLVGKIAGLAPDTMKQIRAGEATGDAKRDALVRFVRGIVQSRGTVSQDDFDAIVAAGYSETQLVEISLAIAIITFTNVFNRINDTTVDFPAVH
ncbi:carboxymuconolactone decarboxylase family protein [Pararobbsia silviterrae]|uniref:Carboxymuconolactone decarboxylase family protein n=1 Tax=Pararobbsia silviterrae TaxID=1792498 RepID=A0A494XWE0_9BURK|nr:carboxymuconolactone decarboxylase family protein [Pararobbsia silviterrae]RKP51913.1 carboxymuconolactone decarboxylase family protein [Pararobbsia silviterrae]